MDVEILKPDQYEQWNEFVDNSPQGDVFCYSWWLNAATKGKFKIYAIIENGSIMAGMPVAFDSENMINIPPLTRTLGILYRKKNYKSSQRQLSAERKWMTELIKFLPIDRFVQMCMHYNFHDWLPFAWKGFSQTTRYTYLINYKEKTISELWNNLDKLRRRTINKANDNQIKVENSDDYNLVYRFVSLTYKRQGLKFRIPFNDLKILDDAILENGNRIIFKAIDKTQIHAVLYVAFNDKSAYYLLSGSDPDLRRMGGHTLVLWEAIKYFSDKVNYFNFCGSDVRRIEEHLQGFGGILTPYYHIYNDRLLEERDSLRHHFNEVLFHCKSIGLKVLHKFRPS